MVSGHVPLEVSGPSDSLIRAVLVEDHPVVRCGLKTLINNQDDMEVIGEASSGMDALTLLSNYSCDVIVADLSLGDINGIEMIRRLKSEK
jgi:DNA-binding NarL/FixJ family response regulator